MKSTTLFDTLQEYLKNNLKKEKSHPGEEADLKPKIEPPPEMGEDFEKKFTARQS